MILKRAGFILIVLFAISLCISAQTLSLVPLVDYGTVQSDIQNVERWGVFELTLHGPSSGNPYTDVQWSATFSQGSQQIKVPGFWDSGSTYKIRFCPPTTGTWTYQTNSTTADLNGKSGALLVTGAIGNNHGPVEVCDTFYLRYSDSTRYHQFGTTAYSWVNQLDSLQELTVKTLAGAPFNKIRMTIFPKDYTYNQYDPPYYAFQQNSGFPKGCNSGSCKEKKCSSYSFDFTKPDPVFWHNFEKRILDLQKLDIEADIIIFHPYDRWGFKNMGAANDDRYLRYCIARFSAYRNVWWSLANEWQFCDPQKKSSDFVRFANIVKQEDPCHRLCSIHCCDYCYWTPPPAELEYSRPYFTHAGIQGSCQDRGLMYRNQWKKPVVWDESIYEGNIPGLGFANLTGYQMAKRFWDATFQGTYQGHSEAFADPCDILFWGKGGVLKGQSPKLIQWFKDIMAMAPPFNELKPQINNNNWILAKQGKYYLVYCRNNKSATTIALPGIDKSSYRVERLHPYLMTTTFIGTAPAGSYSFTPTDTNQIYRFIAADYTSTEAVAGALEDYRNNVKVLSRPGLLTMKFSRGLVHNALRVALIDLKGREITLFNGCLSSEIMPLRLDQAGFGPGTYMIKILSGKNNVVIKTVIL
jgi:hypothetical protein